MGIIYKFKCPNCIYSEDINIGLSKIEHNKKMPNRELACCKNCSLLFSTTNKKCRSCKLKAETNKWFSKKTGVKILDSSIIRGDSNIPCPKCNNKSLKAIPIVFYD